MADVIKMKPPRKARNPSDEMDPDTGMPYSDIPGLEYPEEFALGENLAIGAATGGTGNLVRSAVEKGVKKAAGNAIAGELKDAYGNRVASVAQDARTNATSALQKVKANQPTKEAARAEANINPNFNEKLHLNPKEALEDLRAQSTAAMKTRQSLQNTKELGTNLPEDKSGVSYADRMKSAPMQVGAKDKKAVEGNYTDALKEKPRVGFNESDTTSPPLDYKALNSSKPKPPKK